MKIDVSLLNVKDGDAIIIELVRESQALVMVVDGGRKSHYTTKVKPALELILQKHKKKAPDIVVCTHFDSDHIKGLIPLLGDYIDDIQQVWVHKTPLLLNKYIAEATLILEGDGKLKYMHSPKMRSLIREVLGDATRTNKRAHEQQVSQLLESITELKQFIDLIPEQKLVEPFNDGQILLPDWPEFKILGPTQDYYNELFPQNKPLSAFLKEEMTQQLFVEGRDHMLRLQRNAGITPTPVSPCAKLKKGGGTHLTATNKASIVFAIEDESKRYLFTGDGGIESFKKIPDWEQQLKNIYFLKVPHHGSSNNLSEELIALMRPTFAYSSGDKYQDDEVVGCLEAKGAKVHTTKLEGDLSFDSANPS